MIWQQQKRNLMQIGLKLWVACYKEEQAADCFANTATSLALVQNDFT